MHAKGEFDSPWDLEDFEAFSSTTCNLKLIIKLYSAYTQLVSIISYPPPLPSYAGTLKLDGKMM